MKGSRVQISVSARNQEVASQDATSFSYVAGGAPAACRKTTAGHRGAPYCAGWSAVQTPQGGSRAWKIPATGGRRHIVVWQTTNPLISKNPAPGLRGFRRCRERARPHGGPCRSAGKPAAPAPTDSCRPHVSRNTVCGGSKRMRTLPFIRSAASGRSDRTPERDDIAVLISTRNPAGCKSRKNAKGRSSDSFRFRAFPA